MPISLLLLELWQFLFIRDWPEIWKSEIPLSEFGPISWDWGKLVVPNLTQMSLMKSYWILQNSTVTAFTVSELRGSKQEGRNSPHPPRLGLLSSDPKSLHLILRLFFGHGNMKQTILDQSDLWNLNRNWTIHLCMPNDILKLITLTKKY